MSLVNNHWTSLIWNIGGKVTMAVADMTEGGLYNQRHFDII